MTGLSEKYSIVAAIDFGTTYSGYAFSFRHDYETDPLQSHLNIWSGNTLQSQKAPTCVLFDPNKRFSEFGYEAEDKYTSIASGEQPDEDHRKWFFFRRFKMTLYDKMKLKREYMLDDETGKKMPALDVFAAAIGYLRSHLVEKCKNSVDLLDEGSDIRWVLTVPAIWTDACKQFMREAANKGGIKNEYLLIALEPEAASMCCRHLPLRSIGKEGKVPAFESFVPGSKYMVFDAGGGTVDITVHEVEEDGLHLRELYAANGGNWGGIYVDQAYRNVLASIVGNNIMDDLQTNHTGDYIHLFREFEIKKRNFRKSYMKIIQLRVPVILSELFEKEKHQQRKAYVAAMSQLQGSISWISDKLRIDAKTVEGFFKGACESIVKHLEALFSSGTVADVPTILMVGGFSESPMLQETMKDRFKNKNIIIPVEPGIAVLKGAVIFGHVPTIIEQRCCSKTYGVQTGLPFREGIDPEEDKYINDNGDVQCRNRFNKHVEIGQAVNVGESQPTQSYRPTKADQEQITFKFFASSQSSPEYTYDAGCQSIGSLTIDLEGSGTDRSVEVRMIFGRTELAAEATDKKTGCKVKTTLNFLG